eukprot:CCRYP_001762-RA/>CCRYP_001762-RA protein AED:0.43 eAED:0.43 QI:46/1/1/1/0/0/2/127/76
MTDTIARTSASDITMLYRRFFHLIPNIPLQAPCLQLKISELSHYLLNDNSNITNRNCHVRRVYKVQRRASFPKRTV